MTLHSNSVLTGPRLIQRVLSGGTIKEKYQLLFLSRFIYVNEAPSDLKHNDRWQHLSQMKDVLF